MKAHLTTRTIDIYSVKRNNIYTKKVKQKMGEDKPVVLFIEHPNKINGLHPIEIVSYGLTDSEIEELDEVLAEMVV